MNPRLSRLSRDLRASYENVGKPSVRRMISCDVVAFFDKGCDVREGDLVKILSTGETIKIRRNLGDGAFSVDRSWGATEPAHADSTSEALVVDWDR